MTYDVHFEGGEVGGGWSDVGGGGLASVLDVPF